MNHKPTVAITGCFQNGKSTLVNCLLDDKVAQPGKDGGGLHTTHISIKYEYGELQGVKLFKDENHFEYKTLKWLLDNSDEGKLSEYTRAIVTLWKPILKDVNILDTPGFNVDDTTNKSVEKSIESADYVLVVLNNKQISEIEKSLLKLIAKHKIPFAVIMNCRDNGGHSWNPTTENNNDIIKSCEAIIQNNGFAPNFFDNTCMIIPCNLIWFWYATEHIFEEESEMYENMIYDVKRFVKKKLKKELSASQLAQDSNFLPIRNFFQSHPWHTVSANNAVCRAKLERSVKEWGNDIKETIKKVKEVL